MFREHYPDIGDEALDLYPFCINAEFYSDDISVLHYCNAALVKQGIALLY